MLKLIINRIYRALGLILGIGAIGYGIALKHLHPIGNGINWETFTFIFLGGLVLLIIWLKKIFVDD